jgi:hypothetical protein
MAGPPLDVGFVDPRSFADWDALIARFEEASTFHSASWARLLTGAYHFQPRYCLARDIGRVAAVLPLMIVRNVRGRKKAVALPFSDYCPPLYTAPEAFRETFDFAVASARENGWDSLDIYGNAPLGGEAVPSTSYYRHVLKLRGDEEALRRAFRENTKRNIKRAIKEDVAVSFETSWEAVLEFCRLNALTRKRHGLPPQPAYFFRHLHAALLSAGQGRVAIGRYRGRAVAASVFLEFGRKAFYKYGASDGRSDETRANTLVMWEAIRRYNAAGFESLCFGKTEAHHTGLLHYKTGWGAEQHVVNTYHYDVRQRKFLSAGGRILGFYPAIFRRLPVPVLKIIGFVSYKYMG